MKVVANTTPLISLASIGKLELLKGVFGEESYQRHKAFIKNHNKKIESDEFVQLIEF